MNIFIYLAYDQSLICFTVLPLNLILGGIRYIVMQQALAYLMMDMVCHLCLTCVLFCCMIEVSINNGCVESKLQENTSWDSMHVSSL